jgi:hypothetical protein
MAKFYGTVLSIADDAPVAQYNVRFNLTSLITVPTSEQTSETLSVPTSVSARSGPDGRFQTADLAGELSGPVEIMVSAPNGQEVERQRLSIDNAQKELTLRIKTVAPFSLSPSGDPTLGQRVRLSGHVIDERGRTVPVRLPVVIWGVAPSSNGTEPAARPLIVTETQPNGLFSEAWPTEILARAFGRVAGGPPVPVPLDENRRILRQILLVINLDNIPDDSLPKETDCDCDTVTPRAPEQVDLTSNPSAFSQDLAGGCIDLTTPNRALEEFSYFMVVRTSEPTVKGVTLGVRRHIPQSLLVDLLGVSVASTVLDNHNIASIRLPTADLRLDVRAAKTLVRQDRPPTLSEIERAAWLSEVGETKEQIDTGMRQSSGPVELDASSPIDWDDTPTIYLATGLAHGHILRYREVWHADGYSLGDLLYSLPLAPMQRRKIAVVDWERRTEATREEQLEFEEELDALLSRDRDVQEIVGSDLHEETSGGSSNTTWGIAGGIGAGFIGSGFGIFGGVSGGASGSNSEAWQNSSRQFSADSLQRLRDRVSQRSSSVRNERSTVVQTVSQGETLRAETEVVANYNHCHAITIEYFEVLRHFLVTHELADVQECLFVPLPITEFDRGKALRWCESLTRYLKDRNLKPAFTAIERIADLWIGWDFPEARYSEETIQSIEGELRISFLLPRPRDDKDGKYQVDMWRPYAPWLPVDTLELFTARMNEREARERDLVFRQEVAPEIAKNLVQGLHFAYITTRGGEIEVTLDATLVSRYVESQPLYVSLNPAGTLPSVPREDIAYLKIWFEGQPLPPDAQVIVHSGRARYRTEHMTTFLFNNERVLDDLRDGDPVVIPTTVSRAELRNPRQEDYDLADRLVEHLNKHLEYYHQAIWLSLDTQRRYMLLDAVLMPELDGRSVASVCVNEVIGVAGNSIILPVAPGQRLDPLLNNVDEQGNLVQLEHAYTVPPAPPLRVSVPTRGVYAEAIAGECNVCEAIDDTRYWRWTTDGQLALPEIATVSTGTRASDEPNLTPTDLPKPLVSIQNAPAIPDPFGLSAAFQLLSKPDVFRDITGLEGTQRNAGAAFEAALSAASAMGDEAAKLARQNELARNSERMLNRINQAQKDDLLTPEVAQKLANSVLRGFNGEGQTDAEHPTADKTVANVLDKTAQATNADIKVSTPSETVAVSFEDAPVVGAGSRSQSFDLPPGHSLLFVDQPVLIELGATPQTPPGDLTPFVMDTFDLLKDANPDADAMVSAGHIQRSQGDPHYKLERQLHIVYPADSANPNAVAGTGALPLAVIVHGQHLSWQTSPPRANHEGYTYLQEELANHGILSVAVDTNAANWFDTLVEMRAQMILGAIDALRELEQEQNSPFRNRINYDKVALIGHSRGGEAVVRAAQLNQSQTRPVHYGIQVVCSLAPTDFSGTSPANASWPRLDPNAAAIPFYAVIYGALDGDVSGVGGAKSFGGTGFRLYDRAQTQKAMVFLERCNHNRFNSVWATDGDEESINPQDKIPSAPSSSSRLLDVNQHQELAKKYIGGLLRWRLLGEDAERGLFDGSKVSDPDVSLQYSFGTTIKVLDDMETSLPSRTIDNAATIKPFADITIGTRQLEFETSHQTKVLSLSPNLPNSGVQALKLNMTDKSRDWSGFDALLLRVCADFDRTSQDTISADRLPEFDIVVTGGPDNKTVITSSSALNTKGALQRPVIHELLSQISTKGIAQSSPGNAVTITTTKPHGLVDDQLVIIVGHSGSTPDINGLHKVKVISNKEFSIPVNVTTAGQGGRVLCMLTIVSSSAENPTTIKTLTPHNLVSGSRVFIQNHTGAIPAIGGSYAITVKSPKSFTIPVNVTTGGSDGFLIPLLNVTLLRLETLAMPLTGLSQDIRADVKNLIISPAANFPRHMFFDSLELVRF